MLGNCCLNILISVILGAILALLVGLETISITPVILFWIIFGISVGILALLLISIFVGDEKRLKRCICSRLICLLIGSLGGIIFSALALSIELSIELSLTATAVFVFLTSTTLLVELIGVAELLYCNCPRICE